MSVTTSIAMGQGLFTPFPTLYRGGRDGSQPVGTLFVDATATGDSGGGVIVMNITGVRSQFGFRTAWIPLYIQASDDDGGVPKQFALGYRAEGNTRLSSTLTEVLSGVSDGTGLFAGPFQNTGILIESDSRTAAAVMRMQASVNTDGKVYHFHVYGPVYDRELLAKHGKLDELYTGVR